MLDRSSFCPVQVSSCVSAEKLEMSGGSSAELAACYAFATLAPTRTFIPSSCLSFDCRGVCLSRVSRKHAPSERLAQDAPLPIISAINSIRWLFKQEKQKLFHTSSYTVQPPPSIPCRTLFEPKMTPSQCMQNATARFSAPSPWRPIQTVYRFGRCQRAVVSSPPFQPPDTKHLMFQIMFFKKRQGKENLSDSDGSKGDRLAGVCNHAASHHLIQNSCPHAGTSQTSHGRMHRRNAVLRSFC